MKKIALLLAVLMIAAVFAGCAQPASQPEPTQAPAEEPTRQPETEQPSAEPTAEPAKQDYSDKKVVALLSGVITDGGWNSVGYKCATNLAEKYGVQADYVESIAVSDMEEYLRMYAEDGYDMIIVHGSQFVDNVKNVAPDYPDTAFLISFGDQDVSGGLANVGCVGPKNMGVLIGAVMGILTENNYVAFLGGEENPSISNVVAGIEDGVKLTNPDCKVVTNYIGTLTDSSLAKEMTLQYIADGVDVVSGSANSAQLGILEAAAEKGIYALGFNGDQYEIQPDAVVLSIMRAYPAIYEKVFLEVMNGTFTGGQYAYGLKDGGTVVSDWHGWDAKLPAEKVEAIDKVVSELLSGVYGDY
jgi:basic membrane protein A